jgi:hypothetical protein
VSYLAVPLITLEDGLLAGGVHVTPFVDGVLVCHTGEHEGEQVDHDDHGTSDGTADGEASAPLEHALLGGGEGIVHGVSHSL